MVDIFLILSSCVCCDDNFVDLFGCFFFCCCFFFLLKLYQAWIRIHSHRNFIAYKWSGPKKIIGHLKIS